MNMTSEQRDFLTVIMNNKEILEELLKAASSQKQAKDLQIKESISLAGITWSKFAEDSEGNVYMLADEKICDMEFGENNDWRESPIRKKLNEELYQKIVAELGADALVTIQTDLFSHDGLRDYGKCEDRVSLLTYDLYRNSRENIKGFDEWFWTCTPDSTPPAAALAMCGVSAPVVVWAAAGVASPGLCVRFSSLNLERSERFIIFNLCILRESGGLAKKQARA